MLNDSIMVEIEQNILTLSKDDFHEIMIGKEATQSIHLYN